MVFTAYTDGSCNNKKDISERIGGWAFIILSGTKIYSIRRGKNTDKPSSQTMEMEAVIKCLESANRLRDLTELQIFSDSAYVVNCINQRWYDRWILFDFSYTKNADLWKKILNLLSSSPFKVTFIKIKGHSGNKYNEIVDKLANCKQYETKIV